MSKYKEYPIIGQPIIGNSDYLRRFPDARAAHRCEDVFLKLNITCAYPNIHLSDYRRVQLSADILRPPYPAHNWTLSVLYIALLDF